MADNSGDERHQAGPGERATIEQQTAAEQAAPQDVTVEGEDGGEVGDAIRRAAEEGYEAIPGEDRANEVGEAIRRSG
jgi:hypothetical protein